jgi:tRNA threonylcarbamoyladenosine biosynthesis protein TsaB
MRVLALDTTTRSGSVALVDEARVIAERGGDASRTHAERLPAELLDLLAASGVALEAVDAFAVAAGPGSFTGLRIGIATMQGLAFVEGRPLVAVSALEALAHAAGGAAAVVAACMDAFRGEVFMALYRAVDAASTGLSGAGPVGLDPLDEPSVATAGATLARWREAGLPLPDVFVGDGAVRYTEAIREQAPRARIVEPPPIAGVIGRLAAARLQAGESGDPAAVRPLYVRRPDAELARDARK